MLMTGRMHGKMEGRMESTIQKINGKTKVTPRISKVSSAVYTWYKCAKPEQSLPQELLVLHRRETYGTAQGSANQNNK